VLCGQKEGQGFAETTRGTGHKKNRSQGCIASFPRVLVDAPSLDKDQSALGRRALPAVSSLVAAVYSILKHMSSNLPPWSTCRRMEPDAHRPNHPIRTFHVADQMTRPLDAPSPGTYRMIATTTASLWSDARDEVPAPAPNGRGERRAVAQEVEREGHREEGGEFGVVRWAHTDGGPMRGARGDRPPPRRHGEGISAGKRDPDRGVACLS
jgi:hypothetical protein